MKNLTSLVSSIIFFIGLFFGLIAFSFFSTVFEPDLYERLFEKHEVQTYLPNDNIQKEHDAVIEFLKGTQNLETDFFTKREVVHLVDIRNKINILKVLSYLSMVFIGISILLTIKTSNAYNKKGKKKTKKTVEVVLTNITKSSFWLLCFVFLLLIASFLSFQISFTLFHELFFSGDSYLFDPVEEKIVLLYPQELFFDIFLVLIAKLIFSSAILLLLSFGILKKYYNSSFAKLFSIKKL